MHIIKALNDRCQEFIQNNVPSDMKHDESIIIEFNRIHEVLAALQGAGFERGRDFRVVP